MIPVSKFRLRPQQWKRCDLLGLSSCAQTSGRDCVELPANHLQQEDVSDGDYRCETERRRTFPKAAAPMAGVRREMQESV